MHREARNIPHDIVIDLGTYKRMDAPEDERKAYVYVTRRGGEFGYREFDTAAEAGDYFNGLCQRFEANPGAVCPDCHGKGGREYQETYGLSWADRWGMTATEWAECHTCDGTGWAEETTDDDTSAYDMTAYRINDSLPF